MKDFKSMKIISSALVAGLFLVPTLVPQQVWAQADDAKKAEEKAPDPAAKTDDAPPPESPPAAPPSTPVVEDTDYAIKLRNLEERVNDLKERIFRSKARLVLLRETVLNGVISGAKARLVHRNEMGASFTLTQVSYSLDGAPLFNKTDEEGALDDQEEIELFNGSIVPGNHNIAVYMEYRGNGYGVFSYLQGYTFKIKSSYTFDAEEGKLTTIKIVGYEKGGITTELKDRPAVRYDMKTAVELRSSDAESEGDGGES